MIGYADFVPRMTTSPGFLKAAKYESFDAALAAANHWVAENSIRVTNFETVVLPNVWHPHEEGTTDASLRTSGEHSTFWHQFIRVWYEYGGANDGQ